MTEITLIIEQNPLENAVTEFIAYMEDKRRVFLDRCQEVLKDGECWRLRLTERNGKLRATPLQKVYETEYREEGGTYTQRIFCGRLLISEVGNLYYTRHYVTTSDDIVKALKCHTRRAKKSVIPLEAFKFCLIWEDVITHPLFATVRRNTMLNIEALVEQGHITRAEARKAVKI